MSINPKIVSLVAVRMKSVRLPGKALLPLCGRPVLWHLMGRILRARLPGKAVICTSTLEEDDPIETFAEQNDFDLFRGHPDNVLLRFAEAGEKYRAGHIVRITGDNPLTDPYLIDEMARLHIAEQADYTFTEDPPRGTRPEIISMAAIKRCLELAEEPDNSEYMTLYFKDYPGVFRNIKYSCPQSYCRPDYLVTIDTPEDLEVVKRIYSSLYNKNNEFTLREVIDFLDSRPEIDHAGRINDPAESFKVNTGLKAL
ncbi:MAG: glycosyltransferase family protein [Candidatus Omnitrophica bacterium]|nr:glycosyltransferase family protein [Candidatus Omnitrophota bacterium]